MDTEAQEDNTMKINWHRLFGLLLMDYFADRGFRVELEKDLSLKRQYLDVVIVERAEEAPDLSGICDGFDNLSRHNLLSYKSKRQSLNIWALEELMGHYVNYRKVLGLQRGRGNDIRLYAVSTRYPSGLLSTGQAKEIRPGVWELRVLSRVVRIVVLSQLPLEQRNAILAFFSFDREKVRFALENYQWQRDDGSTVINQLLAKYEMEGIAMPYTMEQFRKDYVKAHLGKLDPEERLEGLKAEERLKGLAAEERLKGLAAEERLKGLAAEERLRGLKAEERLRGLKVEEIEAFLKELKRRKKH